jgi:hypothetical protein
VAQCHQCTIPSVFSGRSLGSRYHVDGTRLYLEPVVAGSSLLEWDMLSVREHGSTQGKSQHASKLLTEPCNMVERGYRLSSLLDVVEGYALELLVKPSLTKGMVAISAASPCGER